MSGISKYKTISQSKENKSTILMINLEDLLHKHATVILAPAKAASTDCFHHRLICQLCLN